jgi:hypothetical protein
MTIRIYKSHLGPAGKVADAELHFDGTSDELAGMKLIGFAIWERRGGGVNVTFPARSYAVNGERRSFALLRPLAPLATTDAELNAGPERLRVQILDAYNAWVAEGEPVSGEPSLG